MDVQGGFTSSLFLRIYSTYIALNRYVISPISYIRLYMRVVSFKLLLL
jgi:hypothetical protein